MVIAGYPKSMSIGKELFANAEHLETRLVEFWKEKEGLGKFRGEPSRRKEDSRIPNSQRPSYLRIHKEL